jgi:predicted DNA binding CopG/RHH family protein
MNTPKDPFDNLVLDEEEQAIEDALERGEFEEIPDLESTRKMLKEAAHRYTNLNTTKPITLRVKQMDLIKIKAKAERNGLPYQTMLSALIHDFAEGKKDLVIK